MALKVPRIPLGEVPWLIPHLGEEVSWYFLPEGSTPPPLADEWLGNEGLSSLATSNPESQEGGGTLEVVFLLVHLFVRHLLEKRDNDKGPGEGSGWRNSSAAWPVV